MKPSIATRSLTFSEAFLIVKDNKMNQNRNQEFWLRRKNMMTKKAFWLTGAVFALLGGIGVGTATVFTKAPQTVEATQTGSGHTWGIIGAFPGHEWADPVATSTYDSVKDADIVSYFIPEGIDFRIRADNSWDHAVGFPEFSQTRTGNPGTWFTGTGDNAQVAPGYAGTYTFAMKNGVYDYVDKSYGITINLVPEGAHYASEFAVVDGVKESTAFRTEMTLKDVSFSPATAHRTGYVFGGWFTDEVCSTPYSPVAWTADGNLYAKYTSCATTSHFYFNVQGIANLYVYTFGQSEAMGYFPGTKVMSMTNGINFLSNGGIAQVAYYADSGDDKMVLSDGSGSYVVGTNKTNDLLISADRYYTINAEANYAGDVDKGAAAKVVYDINVARCAVTAHSGFLAGSVCGMTKALATVLVGEYDALTGDAGVAGTQKYFAATATDYVYNYENTATNVNVSISNIVGQLNLISSGTYVGGARIGLGLNENEESSLTVFILISAGCLGAVAIYFFLKKKKVSIA